MNFPNINKNKFQNIMTKATSIVVLVLLLFSANPVFALTQQEARDQLDQLNAEIGNISSKLTDLRSQKSTLANELAILDAQAESIQLQINSAQAQINYTNDRITETTVQIKQSEIDLARQREIINEYLRVMYMDGQTTTLELIATSDNFSDFIDKSEYLNTMQQKVQEAADKIVALKESLETKKKELEVDKAKAEQLRSEATAKRNALDVQISQRNNLMDATQGSESTYQSILRGKISKKGILECIANGGCNGDTNGSLIVVNQPLHYYQWQEPWGQKLYEPSCWDCTFANYGCLITSLAMYHGITPPQEAAKHDFTGDGLLIGSTGNALVGGWGTVKNTIDMSLIRGQKVIIGLNMGGYDHYVLVVGMSDGKYYINDPYFSAGRTYETSRVIKVIVPY